MEIVLLIIGLSVGFISAWLISKYKFLGQKGISNKEAENFNNQIIELRTEKGKIEERNSILEGNLKQSNDDLSSERAIVLNLNFNLASVTADFSNLKEKLETQKLEMEQIQQKLTTEFKNIANDILEDKSKRFTEQNQKNIFEILNPLSDKIKDFEKKVEQTYDKESRDRISLYTEIKYLKELNQKMSEEANNLTNALKGQSKTQGNWGEVILENILEKSGLRKGQEYSIQERMTDEEGRIFQPDVIINLPEDKHVIVDSKVSLTAYERFCSAEDPNEKESALKEHILSIKKHIKELSQKNYPNLYDMKSLDFILMFIPIEPAFNVAVQNDIGLFNEAFEKNIVIVSISTLLATLRTIANIWRQEKQTTNVLQIAKQAGDLYDKFVSLVDDLIEVGKKLEMTKKSYDETMNKLHKGSGNLVKRAENIRNLGIKTTKSLSQSLLDRADLE
jgi:DNA recombination protein RmuC